MEPSEGEPLTSFLVPFALAYLATALLPSGVLHLGRLRHFGRLLYVHRIVPPVLIGPVAVLVGTLEAGAGLMSLLALIGVRLPLALSALLGGATLLGTGFFLYLILLFLRHPGREVSCGCSPGSGRLTVASLLPALGLIGVGWMGWAAIGASGPLGAQPAAPSWMILAALWGATLAPLMAMVPAALPDATKTIAEARSPA